MEPWLQGARPRTLPAAIAPVLVASAYAGESFSLTGGIAALIVALALQIAVNYANDYSDGIRGTDEGRIGPLRLVASGTKSAKSVKRAAYLSFFIAMSAGSYLAITTSLWFFAVGAISILAAWRYTGGKNPYGYRGLGEISVFVFFGLVATIGTYLVHTKEIDLTIVALGSAMGAIACCILLLNNIRDIETDQRSGKRTLSVRIGAKKSIALYWILISASLVVFLSTSSLPSALLLLPLTPQLIAIRKAIGSGELIRALEATGKFQILFALLLSLALLLGAR
ncbi:MAG: 1,4-dihydroxy-2-naphthoate polyprenyltransferase [Candidatus Nanopelagicaceae bacterium]